LFIKRQQDLKYQTVKTKLDKLKDASVCLASEPPHLARAQFRQEGRLFLTAELSSRPAAASRPVAGMGAKR